MPLYRAYTPDSAKWGSKRLNPEAYILRRSTNNNTMIFDSFGKITQTALSGTFPNNDGTVLVHAICSAKDCSSSSRAATGVAIARAPEPVEVYKYLGKVRSVTEDKVIAEIGPPDDMDRWEVIIPRASFDERPQESQEIACTIARWGSHADITVQILSNKPLPELKDFGIDKEELLSWASQLDV